MKQRRRKQRAPRRASLTWTGFGVPGTSLSFRNVDTVELVVIEDLDEPFPEVRDRFVKLAPRLPASRRTAFDGAAVVRELRDKGARAVVLAPVLVSESQQAEAEKVSRAKSPRDAVKAWFEEQHTTPQETAAALDLVFGFMESEGL